MGSTRVTTSLQVGHFRLDLEGALGKSMLSPTPSLIFNEILMASALVCHILKCALFFADSSGALISLPQMTVSSNGTRKDR